MLQEKWKKLQNGSDIRGVALEGIEGQHVNLTPEVAQKIASAFAQWLSKNKGKDATKLKVSVGNDSRISGPTLRAAVIKGLLMCGCEVVNFGLSSTPAMYVSTVTEGYSYDGAIMITASHLPFNRNGLKFFTNKGGLEKQDITEILTLAQENSFNFAKQQGSVSEVDFISEYSNILVEKIRKNVNYKEDKRQPLKGFKIVVDAGNGAGGFFVDKVLKPLGADTTGSQFLEPDGTFPNHIPNPEDKEAMDSLRRAVLDNKADFGIIFDTDVDRAGAVDRNGREINRNSLIALMSAIVLEEHPGSTIVTDSITSSGLKEFIENDLKGVHHRFKRGYKNVINEAIRLNREGTESHLAIETSGHGALKENYFLDDGSYIIAKILIKMAKLKIEENRDITSLIESLQEPLEAMEFRMDITFEDFKAYGEKVLADLKEYAAAHSNWIVEEKNYEGVRVSFGKNDGDGWFLLRMSLHDPLMPLNIESNLRGGVKTIAAKLVPFLEKYPELNISSLTAYLQAAK